MNLKFIYLLFCLTLLNFQIQSAQLSSTQNGHQDSIEKYKLEQWFQAAKVGDIETLHKLRPTGIINAKNIKGRTALMIAGANGQLKTVAYLLETPFLNVNIQSNTGKTALMTAIIRGHYDIAKMILGGTGLKINVQDQDGITALNYACTSPEPEKIVKHILSHKHIDVNIQDNWGFTALMFAARLDQTTILEQLLQHPEIDVNIQESHGVTALTGAVLKGQKESVKLLLKVPNIDIDLPSIYGYTAVTLARSSNKSHPTAAQILALIEDKIEKESKEVQDKKKQELKQWFQAAKSGDLETIKKLVAAANVNAKNHLGHTALMLAASQGHSRIVKFLLDIPSIDINAQSNTKNTALIEATASEKPDIIRMLLDRPEININMQDQRDETAFMYACSGSLRLAKLFLNRPDLDINIQNDSGFTALIFAVEFELVDVVEELLKLANINVNIQDKSGLSALMLAAKHGNQRIVELLIQAPNINLNTLDNQGNSAIMLAKTSREPMIQMFIESKIEEFRQKAAQALEKQNLEAFAALVEQIGIEPILKSKILKNLCEEKDQRKYIDSLLEKLKTKQDKAIVGTCASKKRKLSEDKAITDCRVCGKKNCVHYCGACHSVYYCSKEHQKADWKNHKKLCKKKKP